jgi:alpha-mannosidase
MQLTLIKCATYPNPESDQGEHNFVYAIYPHAGNLCVADTVKEAYDLNLPLIACAGKNGDGTLPESYSLLSCNRDNVIVETVKESEDGNDLIVRMYETKNMRSTVELTFGFAPKSVSVCTLMEEDEADLPVDGNKVTLTVNPFEIITLKIKR